MHNTKNTGQALVLAALWMSAAALQSQAQTSAPCSACGPGNHWVDSCLAGFDSMENTSVLVGLDLDLDPQCKSDVTFILFPCPPPNHLTIVERKNRSDDSANFPGTSPVDGHLDVIDTEMLSLCLQDVRNSTGTTLRAGSSTATSKPLSQSLGAIFELNDPALAKSFFDVFFELDLPSLGMTLYNRQQLTLRPPWIECVPPPASYFHPQPCIDLYDDPVSGGTLLARLSRAEHAVNVVLLVELESFTAEREKAGVRLRWKTTSEVDNAGFRVRRGRLDKFAESELISPLIPAAGTELEGGSYEYLDTGQQKPGRVYYFLEDLDLYGRVTGHGPVVVEIGGPPAKPRPRTRK